jgi:hypothetical protein
LDCRTEKGETRTLFFSAKKPIERKEKIETGWHFVQEDIRYIEGTAGKFRHKKRNKKAGG